MGQHDDHGEDATGGARPVSMVTPDRRPQSSRRCRPAILHADARIIMPQFIDYCLHSDHKRNIFVQKQVRKACKKLQAFQKYKV